MTARFAAMAGGWTSSAFLLAACIFLWGKWDHAVMQAKIDAGRAAQAVAQAEAANERRKGAATDTYAQRTLEMQPIIIGSTKKADNYAQTDAGRAPCLGADRVQSILADRDALFAQPAGRGAGPVPAGTARSDATEQR